MLNTEINSGHTKMRLIPSSKGKSYPDNYMLSYYYRDVEDRHIIQYEAVGKGEKSFFLVEIVPELKGVSVERTEAEVQGYQDTR
jgi:hypothetical protein